MDGGTRSAWSPTSDDVTFGVDVQDIHADIETEEETSHRRMGLSHPVKPQRKQANHNLNGIVIREFGQTKQETGAFKKIKAVIGSTEKIKKDKLVFFLYVLNIIIVILSIVTYFKYGANVPDEYKTPAAYAIVTGVLYATIAGLTIYQMYQITRRVEPQNRA